MSVQLPHYYEREVTAEERLLFRAGLGLQSAELNDLQSIQSEALRRISDHLLSDGALISGGEVVIDDEGQALCAASSFYLRGRVRDVPERRLTVPITGVAELGIWLSETIITELQDPSLRDPAEGTKNYDEAGAGRLRIKALWGLGSDDREGNFYRVFDLEDGKIKRKSKPQDLNTFNLQLARYDRDNNGGHYVITGLEVVFAEADERQSALVLKEGRARVYGFEVELPHSMRSNFPLDADLQTILSEPHQYQQAGGGKQRIDLNRAPIHDIRKVDVTKAKTTQVLHGSYLGVADVLPDEAVIKIIHVKQGGTTYSVDRDYTFTAGKIDWAPNGQEPAPGSQYEVRYEYITQITPNYDEEGFEVEGLVNGSLVLVDYQWKMPRIDTLTLSQDGQVTRLKGVPDADNPHAPPVPLGQLELAQVRNHWHKAQPLRVLNTAIHAVSMSTLQDMRKDIFDLYDLVASLRLKNEAIATAPSAVRGVFVDPFLDDSMRDLGQEQTAAIVDGELCLPISGSPKALSIDVALCLPYTLEVLIEQNGQTGHMKINPYSAFDPVPARLTLTPAVDYFTQTETVNGADVVRQFGGGNRVRSETREEVRQLQSRQAEKLRPLLVRFEAQGFLANEALRVVRFDGIELEVNP